MVQGEWLLEDCAIKPACLIIDRLIDHIDSEMGSLFISIYVSEDEAHFPLTVGQVYCTSMV